MFMCLKIDLVLNNLPFLICQKSKLNQIIYIFNVYVKRRFGINLQWLVYHSTKPNQLIYISSCRAACTDILDPLSLLLPIVHRLRQVFRATSRILT